MWPPRKGSNTTVGWAARQSPARLGFVLQGVSTVRFIRKSFVRNLFPLIVSVLALFLPVFQAAAIIDATLQMQLGNPTGATTDPNNHSHYLIQRTVEAIDSDTNGCPNWASWDLTSADDCRVSRTDAYATDTSLPSGFRTIGNGTFGTVNGVSYDRGDMCPSADRLDTTADNTMGFLMSNMIVQDSKNNEGVWNTFKGYCRTLLSTQELLIVWGHIISALFMPARATSTLLQISSRLSSALRGFRTASST